METENNQVVDATALWLALEEDKRVPERIHLPHLSGMIGQEIKRFTTAWNKLPTEMRCSLIDLLIDVAEADWEMDFSAIYWLALDDLRAEVRATAVDGLYESEDIRLVPRFRRLLLEDQNAEVRAAAAAGLAQFVLLGELGKIIARSFENAVDALTQSYNNASETLEVRRRVVEALAYTVSDDIEAMIKQAYRDAEFNMRTSAVFAMGRNGDEQWAPIVTSELHNTEPAMRYEAVRAAGELKLESALTDIIGLADDTDSQVQQGAIWALGQIGGRRAIRVLERFRDSEDEAAALAATEALDELDFFKGDLETFFGPPDEFNGEGDGWDDYDDDDDDDGLDDLTIEDDEDLFGD